MYIRKSRLLYTTATVVVYKFCVLIFCKLNQNPTTVTTVSFTERDFPENYVFTHEDSKIDWRTRHSVPWNKMHLICNSTWFYDFKKTRIGNFSWVQMHINCGYILSWTRTLLFVVPFSKSTHSLSHIYL